MKITNESTDPALSAELGHRLAQVRLGKNWTQAQLAREAGVSVPTVKRLEAGAAATTLSNVIRILRALGMASRLDTLVPEPAPSPMAMLKLQSKARRRARPAPKADEPRAGWQWGDDK